MTEYDVEQFLNELHRPLRQLVIREPDDDDTFQQTCLDVLRDCEKFTVANNDEFIAIFKHYFLTIRRRVNSNEFRKYARHGQYTSFSMYIDPLGECQLYHLSEDPRTDPMVMAFEYIDLLPQCYRKVFVLVFIEGLSQLEAGVQLGISNQRLNQMITEGTQIIRDELAAIG